MFEIPDLVGLESGLVIFCTDVELPLGSAERLPLIGHDFFDFRHSDLVSTTPFLQTLYKEFSTKLTDWCI